MPGKCKGGQPRKRRGMSGCPPNIPTRIVSTIGQLVNLTVFLRVDEPGAPITEAGSRAIHV
jgi:hypothetical protein